MGGLQVAEQCALIPAAGWDDAMGFGSLNRGTGPRAWMSGGLVLRTPRQRRADRRGIFARKRATGQILFKVSPTSGASFGPDSRNESHRKGVMGYFGSFNGF